MNAKLLLVCFVCPSVCLHIELCFTDVAVIGLLVTCDKIYYSMIINLCRVPGDTKKSKVECSANNSIGMSYQPCQFIINLKGNDLKLNIKHLFEFTIYKVSYF